MARSATIDRGAERLVGRSLHMGLTVPEPVIVFVTFGDPL